MKSNIFVIVYICFIYLIFTDAQNIQIPGDNPLTADGGSNLVLSCDASGPDAGENPQLEWYDQKGNRIGSGGRKMVLQVDNHHLKLLINDVEEDDAGTYNCTGNINGKLESAHVFVKTKTSTTTGPVRWNITNAPERHDITCSVDSMSVYVPMSVLSTNDLLTWRDPHCQVSNNGTHFVSTIQHSACGTTVSFNTDEVIFENELIIHKQSPQSLIQLNDTAQIDFGLPNNDIVPVRCVYPRNMNVTTSYRPAQSHIRFYEKRYGHLDVVLEQFKTDQFLTELPGRSYPREVELNKDLFFKLRASHVNSSDVALKVDSCIATPSLFPASSQTYELIKQGCPASPAVKLFASSFDEVRFSVRAFEFRKSPGGVVYIHCQVSLCFSASPQCVTGCSSRHRREAVGTDGPSQLISGGPYMVVADEGSIQASTVVAAVCACIAVISTVFAVVGWKRKTERSAA